MLVKLRQGLVNLSSHLGTSAGNAIFLTVQIALVFGAVAIISLIPAIFVWGIWELLDSIIPYEAAFIPSYVLVFTLVILNALFRWAYSKPEAKAIENSPSASSKPATEEGETISQSGAILQIISGEVEEGVIVITGNEAGLDMLRTSVEKALSNRDLVYCLKSEFGEEQVLISYLSEDLLPDDEGDEDDEVNGDGRYVH